ncbi:MAG: hypothetical protein U5Q16_17445 [Gammaproteobacteria bacterium]|nr:hypothetical protein [Gammaproteobacteria bacterium]
MQQQDQANYATFEPSRDLKPFVHRYLHGWRDDDGSNWLRIPPTGGVFLSYVPGAPLRTLAAAVTTPDHGCSSAASYGSSNRCCRAWGASAW